MLHAREDYNRIQDPLHLIPEDEPVFLIRAQDICAPDVVYYWALKAAHYGADKDITDSAKLQVSRMKKWQKEHLVKIPDMEK